MSSETKGLRMIIEVGLFEVALGTLAEAQARVVEAARELAEDPTPGGAPERNLLAALEAREQEVHRAGEALLRWIAAGGGIEVIDPAPSDILDVRDDSPPELAVVEDETIPEVVEVESDPPLEPVGVVDEDTDTAPAEAEPEPTSDLADVLSAMRDEERAERISRRHLDPALSNAPSAPLSDVRAADGDLR